jgi:sulfur relay (sulfurtransferase) DsrF/TusC family protein
MCGKELAKQLAEVTAFLQNFGQVNVYLCRNSLHRRQF